MAKLKAVGQRGSWFATVAGESLACVHHHWMKAGRYCDPYLNLVEPKWSDFVESIKAKKRVILTRDKVIDGGKLMEREAYIAIFSVDEIDVSGDALRFKFIKRLSELE